MNYRFRGKINLWSIFWLTHVGCCDWPQSRLTASAHPVVDSVHGCSRSQAAGQSDWLNGGPSSNPGVLRACDRGGHASCSDVRKTHDWSAGSGVAAGYYRPYWRTPRSAH